jgi:hypothetical protein
MTSTPLPFPPATVPVDELAGKLADIDSVSVLNALQQDDTRLTAAPHYERRINALQEGDGITDEDRKRGYRVTMWAEKHENYECLECPFKTLDHSKIEHHVQAHR